MISTALHILNRLVLLLYILCNSSTEIMNMISKLKISKADGHGNIMPSFLKISANTIAYPLSAILNQCIAFGYFSNKLNIEK